MTESEIKVPQKMEDRSHDIYLNLEKKVCIMSNEIEMNISINVTMCPRPERKTGVPEGLKTWWGQCLKIIKVMEVLKIK